VVSLVAFDEALEPLVRFVEDTEPADMVAESCKRLGGGVTPERLLEAAALAVSRSTVLPPSHHGGPVHPVAGLYAIAKLGARLAGPGARLPAIQSLALANKHVHAPHMGPGAMPAIEPGELKAMNVAELQAGLHEALQKRLAAAAERHLVALLEVAEPVQILDVLLRTALPRNALDDHYFLYVVYAFRALDAVGWDHAAVILRPTVAFLARHPMMDPAAGERGRIIADGIALYRNYSALEALVDDRGLDGAGTAFDTSAEEAAAIDALAERVALADSVTTVPEMLADAIVGGLSVMGALEALSVGGGRRYLRSCTGNPFDVHIHTGVNARRYLLSLPGLSLRTKLLALLSWGQGYEVRHLDRSMQWPVGAAPEAIARLPRRSQTELLAAIADSIAGQPVVDLSKLTGSIADLVAPESVHETIALAQQYAELGYGPEPFFDLMAELVCRDDQSEMHAYKLQQAAYEEYHATREPFRRVHMVAAAKHLAGVVQLRPQTVYASARALLDG
jgi:hypothetical protein